MIRDILQFPIPEIETKIQTEIVKNVDLLLQLNKELQTVTLPERIEQIQSRIGYCEDRVDGLVYGMFGVTDEEVEIIETK